MDVIDVGAGYIKSKKYHDSHTGGQAVLVATVKAGDSFPTKRKDGSDLILGDFVKPSVDATFPFTISGITFNSHNDQAVYTGNGNWLANANPFQDTSETPVKNKTHESISGTANYQDEINKELKAASAGFVYEQTVASDTWRINHKMNKHPSVTVIDSAGNTCEGEIIYSDKDNITLEFSAAFSGKAYLS